MKETQRLSIHLTDGKLYSFFVGVPRWLKGGQYFLKRGWFLIGMGLLLFPMACATDEAPPKHATGGEGMMASTEGTVSVDGAELYYSTRGSGPTCLVLCSIGTEPYQRLTPPPLAESLRLVYVDLRGSGRSTGNPTDLTFEVLAADLEAIRGELGVDQVAVLGYSIMGVPAIEYGRRHPQSVSHVIAVGTPPSWDMALLAAGSSAFFEEHASEDRKQVLRDNLANLPEGASMGATMHAQAPMRFYDARFDSAPLFAGADVKSGLLGHIMGTLTLGWSISAEPSSLRVPIFIAQGRHDYAVPHVLWDGVIDTLPNSTLHLFEKSGHQPFFEEPAAFADALSKWMAGQG